jgi:hypothetical protein
MNIETVNELIASLESAGAADDFAKQLRQEAK